ncbi:uncharacterized protein JN550_008231 [Neoarthrinium moseri]|uniref:uncharacterized protein n=1 Tax=Neoarthrinium moseri TaxID=1658444 RepID=UPI001FDD396C|nr:uncharacterized protein JN550_008231 [Neoarthrinium moseri]KAI1865474.1 hypothetical protein JN550_008231 [Neoarthrinium moseri]
MERPKAPTPANDGDTSNIMVPHVTANAASSTKAENRIGSDERANKKADMEARRKHEKRLACLWQSPVKGDVYIYYWNSNQFLGRFDGAVLSGGSDYWRDWLMIAPRNIYGIAVANLAGLAKGNREDIVDLYESLYFIHNPVKYNIPDIWKFVKDHSQSRPGGSVGSARCLMPIASAYRIATLYRMPELSITSLRKLRQTALEIHAYLTELSAMDLKEWLSKRGSQGKNANPAAVHDALAHLCRGCVIADKYAERAAMGHRGPVESRYSDACINALQAVLQLFLFIEDVYTTHRYKRRSRMCPWDRLYHFAKHSERLGREILRLRNNCEAKKRRQENERVRKAATANAQSEGSPDAGLLPHDVFGELLESGDISNERKGKSKEKAGETFMGHDRLFCRDCRKIDKKRGVSIESVSGYQDPAIATPGSMDNDVVSVTGTQSDDTDSGVSGCTGKEESLGPSKFSESTLEVESKANKLMTTGEYNEKSDSHDDDARSTCSVNQILEHEHAVTGEVEEKPSRSDNQTADTNDVHTEQDTLEASLGGDQSMYPPTEGKRGRSQSNPIEELPQMIDETTRRAVDMWKERERIST